MKKYTLIALICLLGAALNIHAAEFIERPQVHQESEALKVSHLLHPDVAAIATDEVAAQKAFATKQTVVNETGTPTISLYQLSSRASAHNVVAQINASIPGGLDYAEQSKLNTAIISAQKTPQINFENINEVLTAIAQNHSDSQLTPKEFAKTFFDKLGTAEKTKTFSWDNIYNLMKIQVSHVYKTLKKSVPAVISDPRTKIDLTSVFTQPQAPAPVAEEIDAFIKTDPATQTPVEATQTSRRTMPLEILPASAPRITRLPETATRNLEQVKASSRTSVSEAERIKPLDFTSRTYIYGTKRGSNLENPVSKIESFTDLSTFSTQLDTALLSADRTTSLQVIAKILDIKGATTAEEIQSQIAELQAAVQDLKSINANLPLINRILATISKPEFELRITRVDPFYAYGANNKPAQIKAFVERLAQLCENKHVFDTPKPTLTVPAEAAPAEQITSPTAQTLTPTQTPADAAPTRMAQPTAFFQEPIHDGLPPALSIPELKMLSDPREPKRSPASTISGSSAQGSAGSDVSSGSSGFR